MINICAMNNMDLNLLPVFDALIRHRSVGKAAEELGMSQPGLSYALKRLRSHFGDPLFIRTRQGMAPTERAEQVAPTIAHLLQQVRSQLTASPSFDPRHSTKVFTLAMSDLGDLIILPKLQRALELVAPRIGINVKALSGDQAIDALQSGQVDLAIGYLPAIKGADIFQQRLYEHGFVCIARKGHPHIGGGVDRERFLSLRHVSVSNAGRTNSLLEQVFSRQKIAVRAQLQVPSILSLPAIVAATDYVATVPAAVAELFSSTAGIRVFEGPASLPKVTVRQCWHRRNQAEPGNRWLRGLIGELFRGKDGWRLQ